ncbi:uncharacterized protein LOC135833258 isoform X4 [Planococcus citri]|uniref:uncharacterized protein LOC135833258 isoform X4 n=1 Tax=Planococcus citri TaxID=170843 RepID=UPI0031F7FFC8
MNVFNDIVKIANQIRGIENIFGYESTIANQFYLVYCFLGEIYFSTKFHRHTKIIWFLWQILGLSGGIVQLVSYLLDYKNDVLALIYTILVSTMAFLMCFLIPYISVICYRGNLRDAIQTADCIVMNRKSANREPSDELNLGKWIKYTFLSTFLTLSAYCFICDFSVIFFYEEEKVKNYVYYLITAPKLEQYGSLPFFFIFSNATRLISTFLFISWLMMLYMLVFCTVVFYNEVQQIIDDLNLLSSNNMTTESHKHMHNQFKNTIIKCTREYQTAIKMIECFRGFYETLAAFLLPTLLYFEITHAFLFVSPNISITVRLRELSAFLTTIQPVFMMCWMGDMLDESAEALSFAVYSAPWYWSTSLRKDVYILMCQTQKPISAETLGAYPLCLATFLRFMNVVQSSVNVLRTITSK